jgi:DNA-binding NarL/FixJ family response regulator
MDIRMPEMDGLEATRQIVAEGAAEGARVIVLTTFDIDDYVYEALRAGASGFLLKDAPADDLVAAIRVVAGGEALLAPAVTRRVIEAFATQAPPTTPVRGLDDLTDRETEVLRLVARGLSNAEIAEQLFVGETTIKTHVSHILTKLGVRDRVQAVVAAYESGLVQPGS